VARSAAAGRTSYHPVMKTAGITAALPAQDLDRARAFYVEKVGLQASRSTTRRRRGSRMALRGCRVEARRRGSRTRKATCSALFQPEENQPRRILARLRRRRRKLWSRLLVRSGIGCTEPGAGSPRQRPQAQSRAGAAGNLAHITHHDSLVTSERILRPNSGGGAHRISSWLPAGQSSGATLIACRLVRVSGPDGTRCLADPIQCPDCDDLGSRI
jgi:hypothetical protein